PALAAERGPLVTVVGGGIAGLVAAIAARENGAEVRLYERRSELGGRARSSAGPWIANFGPHGFLRGGPAHRWLKARGLAPNLASISPARTRFHFQGKMRRNLQFAITARTVAGARRAAPNDLTFSAWTASE